MLFVFIIEIAFISIGFFLLYRFLYKQWKKVDISEKQEELDLTLEQFNKVSTSKDKFKNIKEAREQIEKFKKL